MGKEVDAGAMSKRLSPAKIVYIAIVILTLFPFDKFDLPTVKRVGMRPLMLDIILWVAIGTLSFVVVMATI